ncbi:hypothetical protein [Cerasicoccus fimbriatus]|uniref:hypothetical protein n=1 Tax=Cerasicoccus fimbriatus TaxID=3014554 RepID=UPI0022B2B7FC|nr:hypothetical protein [Cerasicoccus sp. TK19100]
MAFGLLASGITAAFGLSPAPYHFPGEAALADVVFIGKMVNARHIENYTFRQYGQAMSLNDVTLIDLEVVESFTPGFESEVVELFGISTFGLGLGYRSDIRYHKDSVALFMAKKTDVDNQYSVSIYGYADLRYRTEELQALRVWKEGGYEGDLRIIYDRICAEKERLEKERIAREKAWNDAQLKKLEPILMIADRAERRRQLMALIESSGFEGVREKQPSRSTLEPMDWRDEFWRVVLGHVEVIDLIERNKPTDQSNSGR